MSPRARRSQNRNIQPFIVRTAGVPARKQNDCGALRSVYVEISIRNVHKLFRPKCTHP